MWTVIYDDPKRKRGPAHSLHRTGCRDIGRAVDRGGNAVRLRAETVDAALVEAQYGGPEVRPGADLGDVEVAPCVPKALGARNWEDWASHLFDHSQCSPDAHSRDADDRCPHCQQPVLYCETSERYHHADPNAPTCFLIHD